MSGDFIGMTAFLGTTLLFMVMAFLFWIKANQAQQSLNQLIRKANQEMSHDYETTSKR